MENDIITMQDLFTYHVTGEDENGKLKGEFRWNNSPPRCKELRLLAQQTGLFKGM